MFNKISKNGFTLVELLVVIAIIAILFAVILIAINPAQRFKDSRNSRRLSDVKSIVEAATTYTADRRGTQLPDVPDYQCIGSKSAQDFQSSIPAGSTAFWKMDEVSGSLADSAGTNNALTPVSISYESSGRFNKSVALNGFNSLMYAASHVDLSPTIAVTLEAWFKLNSSVSPLKGFSVGLIDKGNYRIGLDRQTGSAFFELDDASASAPSRAMNGSTHGVYALAVYNGKLYAGLGEATGEGKLYESSDGSSWSLVASYPDTPNAIFSLIVYNDKLYAGQGDTGSDNGKIYSFDGTNWKLEYVTGAWDIRSFTIFNNRLYAGTGGANNTAEVYEHDGQNWRSLNLSSFFPNNRLYAMREYNGALYAGTGGTNFAQMVRWDGGVNWISIANNSNYTAVYSLEVFDGKLFFGIGKPGTNNSGIVGNYNGSAINWGGGVNTEAVYSLVVYHGKLYAGHGGDIISERKIRVYAFVGAVYSWSDLYTETAPVTNDNSENIQSMVDFQGKLFVGERGDNSNPYIDGDILKFDNGQILFSKKRSWNANQWYYVATTWDQASSTAHLYINGSEDNSSSFLLGSSTIEGVSTPLFIGNDHSIGTLNGFLDNVSIYNTVLDAATIASHAGCYNLGQYLAPEYMGTLPIDPSSTVTDGTDTGYFISKDTGGVITITAPLTETTSSVPEIIKASR